MAPAQAGPTEHPVGADDPHFAAFREIAQVVRRDAFDCVPRVIRGHPLYGQRDVVVAGTLAVARAQPVAEQDYIAIGTTIGASVLPNFVLGPILILIFFLIGASFSAITGYMGMWLAVRGNVRVAAAADLWRADHERGHQANHEERRSPVGDVVDPAAQHQSDH